MSADQARTMIIVAASIAIRRNSPPAPPTPTFPPAEPITLDELCKRLEISKPTAWAWEKKGLIKGHHLGNRKYFIWQEVISALTKEKKEVKV